MSNKGDQITRLKRGLSYKGYWGSWETLCLSLTGVKSHFAHGAIGGTHRVSRTLTAGRTGAPIVSTSSCRSDSIRLCNSNCIVCELLAKLTAWVCKKALIGTHASGVLLRRGFDPTNSYESLAQV